MGKSSRTRSPVPPSRHNRVKKFVEDDKAVDISSTGEDEEESETPYTKDIIPPTKRDVSRVLSKLVGTTTGGGNREQQVEALDTLAGWSIKSNYQVRTMGYLKMYAAIPLLLDYIEDHAGVVVEEEVQKQILEAQHAKATADITDRKPDAPPTTPRTVYDSHLVKKAAHVLAEMTYAGGKNAPPARAAIAEQIAVLIVDCQGVEVLLKAVEAGIMSVTTPTHPKTDAEMTTDAPTTDATRTTTTTATTTTGGGGGGDPPEGGGAPSDGEESPTVTVTTTPKTEPLPSSVSSLWSALWNINSKESVHKSMSNATKMLLYKHALTCFEALGGDDDIDQRIATNIFKILRHLMPPCSDFDDGAVKSIQSQFAMNRVVASTLARGDETWLKNQPLMKSLVQWMYRYLQLPGMSSEDVTPRSIWEDLVVPLVAKAMKAHPTQREIHWCGTHILTTAVNTVGVTKEVMDATEAFSAIAVTIENAAEDPLTQKRAQDLLTVLMGNVNVED